MGGTFAKLVKPIKNYNILNRANRELERQHKSKVGFAAPKHVRQEVDEQQKTLEMAEYSKSNTKDEKLVERVGKMDIQAGEMQQSQSDLRPLPSSTKSSPDFEYGFHIPDSVPRGKITLPQALQFLSRYKEEHPSYTVRDIVMQYNLTEGKVRAIVKHFQMLNIYLPKRVIDKAAELESFNVSPQILEKLTTIKSQSDTREKKDLVGAEDKDKK